MIIEKIAKKLKESNFPLIKETNKNSALEKVGKDGLLLAYMSYELQDDEDVVFSAVEQNHYAMEFASNRLKNSVNFATRCILQRGAILEFFSKEIQDNEQIVLIATTNSPFSIQFASERLRDNEGIVKNAIQLGSYSTVISYVSERLQKNKKFISELLDKNKLYYEYIHPSLQNDKDIIKKALRSEVDLSFIPPHLLRDDSFIISVLEEKISLFPIFKNLSNSYKYNKAFLLYILPQNTNLIDFFPQEILNDRAFIKECLIKKIPIFMKLPLSMRDDFNLAKLAISNNFYNYRHISDRLKQNYNLAQYAVSISGDTLEVVADNLKDEKLFLLALQKSKNAFYYYPKKITNKKLLNTILKNKLLSLGLFKRLPDKFKKNYQIILEAVQNDGQILSVLDSEFTNNKEIVLASINSYANAYQYASLELKYDLELSLFALEKDIFNKNHLPSDIKELIYDDPISGIKKLILQKELEKTLGHRNKKGLLKI